MGWDDWVLGAATGGLYNAGKAVEGSTQTDFNATAQTIGNQNIASQNTALDPGTLAKQNAFADSIMAQANGQGPSVSASLLGQAQQQNAANAMAQASSMRGVNAGLAMRQAMQSSAAQNQQAAQQAMIGRQQEQLNAQGMAGSQLNSMQGQNMNMQQFNSGQNLKAQQANQASNLSAQQSNQLANLNAQKINADVAMNNTGNKTQLIGGLIQGAGGMGAAMMSRGGKVPGKAPLKGDSKANDTVPTMLSPGEIVIPRSHAHDPELAKKFVERELAKRRGNGGKHIEKMKQVHHALGQAIAMMSDGGEVEEQPSPQSTPPKPLEIEAVSPQQTQQGLPPLQVEPITAPSSDGSGPPPSMLGVPSGPETELQHDTAEAAHAIPSGGDGMSKELAGIQAKQMGAAQASASAQAQGQTNIAQAYAQQAEDLKKTQAVYQSHYATLEKEHAQLMKDYQDQKIDPHRILGSTGAKIQAGISIMLGSIGQAMTHGNSNVAMDMINRAIDRDIEGQKANLGKTSSLLNMNMQKFHNLDQAEAVTRMQKLAAVQSLVNSYAAKAGSQQALANGQMASAQIQQQMIPLKNEIAYRQALSSMGQGGGGNINPENLHEKDRERAVTVPGQDGKPRTVLAPSAKDADEFKKSELETKGLMQKVQEGLKFMDEKGWSPGVGPWDTEDSANADSIKHSIVSSLGKLHDLNRLNDNEFEMFKKMVPNPGQLNASAARSRLSYLAKVIQDKHNNAASAYLENYNPGSIQESAPRMRGAR